MIPVMVTEKKKSQKMSLEEFIFFKDVLSQILKGNEFFNQLMFRTFLVILILTKKPFEKRIWSCRKDRLWFIDWIWTIYIFTFALYKIRLIFLWILSIVFFSKRRLNLFLWILFQFLFLILILFDSGWVHSRLILLSFTYFLHFIVRFVVCHKTNRFWILSLRLLIIH